MLTYDKIRKCKFMKNYCRFSVESIAYFEKSTFETAVIFGRSAMFI